MSDTSTRTPAILTGKHRLWGWSKAFDAAALHQRIFGFLVQMAAPVVKEYHGDLFHDARWLTNNVTGPGSFLFCVRHSGTNIGHSARLMYESVAYDAVLYNIDVSIEKGGEWFLTVDVLGARPARATASTADRVLDVARDLRSEHGENPEYDRALVEMSGDLIPFDGEKEEVAAMICVTL